jgi:hypothetical protein
MPIVGYSRVSGFSPLQVGWTHAYWAEGPEFVALGLSDGGAVSTWPDEVGTLDALQATTAKKPSYSAAGGPNSTPTATFDGGDGVLTGTHSQAQTWSIVTIVKTTAPGGIYYFLGSPSPLVTLTMNNSGTPYGFYAGAPGPGVGTVNTSWHLMRCKGAGASSVTELDGTPATGNAGSASLGNIGIGSYDGAGGVGLVGSICFVGIANGDVTTDPKWASFKAWVTSHYGITVA